jgi:transcriptional regulator
MYQLPSFREDRVEVQHQLIRDHPLGVLITAGPGGLMASAIPFLIEKDGAKSGTLQAHIARVNPQRQELAAVGECLVIFQGLQGYVTPSWYATKRESGKVVPTWNYATVHAWGRPRLIDDTTWIRRQIDALTRQQEASSLTPWNVQDAPEEFIASQLGAIIGVEIPISRIEGKWKVSQNRSDADRAGVIAGFRGLGEQSRAMANLVEECGSRSKRSDVP